MQVYLVIKSSVKKIGLKRNATNATIKMTEKEVSAIKARLTPTKIAGLVSLRVLLRDDTFRIGWFPYLAR